MLGGFFPVYVNELTKALGELEIVLKTKTEKSVCVAFQYFSNPFLQLLLEILDHVCVLQFDGSWTEKHIK